MVPEVRVVNRPDKSKPGLRSRNDAAPLRRPDPAANLSGDLSGEQR